MRWLKAPIVLLEIVEGCVVSAACYYWGRALQPFSSECEILPSVQITVQELELIQQGYNSDPCSRDKLPDLKP